MIDFLKNIFHKNERKDVALVLSGGGARGYAHIGAIEVLQEHCYNITSVAGTSMGALVGGLFAAGKLEELKDIVLNVSKRQIFSLVDVSIGLDHIATAEKLRKLLDDMTSGKNIEDLPIPFCCSASDLVSGREHIFRSGSLSEAIRASISIPGVFSPVRINDEVLVDGSVHNTLPLNRVERHKNDLLVAVNVSGPDNNFQPPKPKATTAKEQGTLWGKVKEKLPFLNMQLSDNYLKVTFRVAQLSVQNNTQMALALTPPDICMNMPMDSFGLMEFDRGREIIDYGRREMEKTLERHNAICK